MSELLQALAWPIVSALALWISHKHGERFWEHKRESRQLSDTARLDRVENEQRSLIQAQLMKGLR